MFGSGSIDHKDRSFASRETIEGSHSYAEPNDFNTLSFKVRISDTREISIEIPKTSVYFPVFMRLVIDQKPELFGTHHEKVPSQGFYEDLEKLEAQIRAIKFIVNEDELGRLVALKNNLLKPLGGEMLGASSFESIEEKNIYARRLLRFVSNLKKLKPKKKKNGVEQTLRNFETQCLSVLADNYFKSGDYLLAEGTYLKLSYKSADISNNKDKISDIFLFECNIRLAKIYLHQKVYGAAARCNQKAIESFSPEILFARGKYTEDLRIFTMLAQAYLKKDDKAEAIDFFQQSLFASQKMLAGIKRYQSEKMELLASAEPSSNASYSNPLERALVEERKGARKIISAWLKTSKEAGDFLEMQIRTIEMMLENLKRPPPPQQIEKPEKTARASPYKSGLQTSFEKSTPQATEKAKDDQTSRQVDDEFKAHGRQLESLTYSAKSKTSRNANKSRKPVQAPASPSAAPVITTIKQTEVPLVDNRPGFISRYVVNNKTGAGFIFRLNQIHLDGLIKDEKFKGRLQTKFTEAEFVSGKGKQGFKYAAHEEKTVKAGYFIKLKLLGDDGLGDVRIYGRASGHEREDGLIEIIFDGIDLDAHSNKSSIISPKLA